MKKLFWFLCLLLCSAAIFACNQVPSAQDQIALEVGDRKITLKQLKKDIVLQSASMLNPDSEVIKLEGPLLDSIVDYYLVQNYAEKHGISISMAELLRAIRTIKKDYPGNSFEETLLRRYLTLEQWEEGLKRELLRKKVFEALTMATQPPSSQEIEQYYRAHIKKYKTPARVRFRQIVTRSEKEAREALDRIKKGASIQDLAPQYSYSPEAAMGGEVGWVEKGQLVPAMEKVLFSLPVGKVSQIIKSPYGYHIFQVIDIDPGGVQPLEEVAGKIQAQLYNAAKEETFNKWLSGQRAHTKIKVITKTIERKKHSDEKA